VANTEAYKHNAPVATTHQMLCRQSDPKAPKLSPAEIEESNKEFLTLFQLGSASDLKLYYTNKSGVPSRVCINGITRGCYCRWGK
jgi:hypothetical protein